MISKHILSILISIPILFVLKLLTKALPYTRQGFFCDDDEIRFPYREDTIKTRSMWFIFICIGCLLFILSEYSLIRHLTQKGRRLVATSTSVHPFVYSFIFLLASYVCSALATSVTSTFSKKIISRLRPNFLAVCQPNLTVHCPPSDSHVFVQDYVCYGEFLEDEYYSFPSGHSASACNFAIFLIIYLQRRFKCNEALRAFIQYAIFLFSVYILCSRIRDYKHRLADVLGGATLGALFALFFVTHVINNFKPNKYEIREDDREECTSVRESTNQTIYPTIVVNKSDRSSGYGSTDDQETSRGYERI